MSRSSPQPFPSPSLIRTLPVALMGRQPLVASRIRPGHLTPRARRVRQVGTTAATAHRLIRQAGQSVLRRLDRAVRRDRLRNHRLPLVRVSPVTRRLRPSRLRHHPANPLPLAVRHHPVLTMHPKHQVPQVNTIPGPVPTVIPPPATNRAHPRRKGPGIRPSSTATPPEMELSTMRGTEAPTTTCSATITVRVPATTTGAPMSGPTRRLIISVPMWQSQLHMAATTARIWTTVLAENRHPVMATASVRILAGLRRA